MQASNTASDPLAIVEIHMILCLESKSGVQVAGIDAGKLRARAERRSRCAGMVVRHREGRLLGFLP